MLHTPTTTAIKAVRVDADADADANADADADADTDAEVVVAISGLATEVVVAIAAVNEDVWPVQRQCKDEYTDEQCMDEQCMDEQFPQPLHLPALSQLPCPEFLEVPKRAARHVPPKRASASRWGRKRQAVADVDGGDGGASTDGESEDEGEEGEESSPHVQMCTDLLREHKNDPTRKQPPRSPPRPRADTGTCAQANTAAAPDLSLGSHAWTAGGWAVATAVSA